MPTRIAPSSFDPNDPGLLARIIPDTGWDSCAKILAFFGAKNVLLQLPLFWQVMTPLHKVCRDLGAAFYPNEPENVPVGVAAILRANTNVVIIEAPRATDFADMLLEQNVPLPAWILIHRMTDPWTVPEMLRLHVARVAQEVHSAPGIPMLVQCKEIAGPERRFHLVTDADVQGLQKSHTCSCGKDIYV